MKRRLPALLMTSTLALGGLAATAPAASAQAAPGEASLAALLTSDDDQFDGNAKDFDIVTEAALAVIGAKPDSPVGLIADGTTRLTVFAPTDQAFRLLVKDLSGETIRSEKKVFEALVELAGVDTIETVLLYHVVPGKTLTSGKVLQADGARLMTAAGKTVKVKVAMQPKLSVILKDKDRDDRNPRAVLDSLDLNKGNKQIAHGINRVLRPINL